MTLKIELTVNGQKRSLETEAKRHLLDVLREDLALTGAKYGCGESQCGACTVLLDGKAIRSCVTPIEQAQGHEIRTIEGLADGNRLHPVQQAFIDAGAMQCGYCVPGMIMNAVGLLAHNPAPSRAEIIEGMNGNICRCCNYPSILAAVEKAASMMKEAKGQ